MSYGTRRRRHDLTIGDKMEMIRMIDNRVSQTDIAKMYTCSQSQISRIVSKREEIIADYSNCDDPEKKKSRFSKSVGRQESSSSSRKTETPPMMADQSTSPRPPSDTTFDGQEQPKTEDSQNNGWLEYWKNQSSTFARRSFSNFESADYSHRLSGSGMKRGPKPRPKPSTHKESRISNQMLDILKNYDVCDVYCADELALHYDAMPNLDSSAHEDNDDDADKKEGETTSNQRQITVLLTSNVTGSDKRDLLIIEDSKRPEAQEMMEGMAGCQRAKAPHAWMTSDIFQEFLLALDYDMRQQRRYILLLVDNAPPHDPEVGKNMEHVRVLYVRSYTTPFFHGLFYSVRAHYRKQILLKLVASNPDLAVKGERGKGKREKQPLTLSVEIDLEEAVNMLKLAWKSVSAQDVVQCFSKSGLCAPHIHGLPEFDGDELPELPDGFVTDEQYEEFVNIDVDAECTGDADLISTECRILSDLRDQGFTDVGIELPDDPSDMNMSTNSSGSGGKMQDGSMPGFRSVKGLDNSGEIERSLSTLRTFLEQRNLHLHNLHALEAQIYSCHSGGH